MSKIAHPEDSRSQITPRLENEKELTSMIMGMETKHGKISRLRYAYVRYIVREKCVVHNFLFFFF